MLTAFSPGESDLPRVKGTCPSSPPSGRGENSGFSVLKGKSPSVFSPTTRYALPICNLLQAQEGLNSELEKRQSRRERSTAALEAQAQSWSSRRRRWAAASPITSPCSKWQLVISVDV